MLTSILRDKANVALESVFKEFSPKDYYAEASNNDDGIIVGCVNVLTAIDVMHPPRGDDKRIGGVVKQFKRIIEDRKPVRMQLLSEDEMKRRFPDKEVPKIKNG